MRKNEKLKEIFEDIEIPQELMPENIAVMLQNSKKNKLQIHKTTNQKPTSKSVQNIKVTTNSSVKSKKVYSNKNKYMRVLATAAACLVVIAGITVFTRNGNDGSKIPMHSSDDKPVGTMSSGSYEDVYNTLKKVYVTDKAQSELETIIKQEEKETTEESVCVLSKSYNASSVLNVDYVSSIIDKKQPYLAPVNLLEDGNNIYCIADNSIYFIDSSDGNLTILKQLKRENITPVGMFLNGSNLVVLSEIIQEVNKPTINEPEETTVSDIESDTKIVDDETDVTSSETEPLESEETGATEEETEEETSQTESSDDEENNTFNQIIDGFNTTFEETTLDETTTSEQTSKVTTSVVDNSSCEKITVKTVLAEVYDVTDPDSPVLLNEIKQDGKYISATMNGANIYIASGYNDNKNNVIKGEEDIDKYVPSYTVNGSKNYILAENIIAAENVTNTNYIVVTGLDMKSVSPVKATTAMLGFDNDIYFSNGNLYVYVNEYGEDTQSSVITKMRASGGNISNPQSVRVNGVIKNINCINESNGYLKVVSSVYNSEDATFTNGIYIFSEDLEKVGSLKGFGGKAIIKNVRFEDKTVYCQTNDEENTVIAIDCLDPSTPLVFNDTEIKGSIPMVYNIGNDNYVAVGTLTNEMMFATGVELSVYQKDVATEEYAQKSTIELPESIVDSELDSKIISKVIYTNKEKSQFGISVSYNNGIEIRNKFYMIKYADGKLECVGEPIEYHDVNNNYQFTSSFANGDKLYIISTGRIVCVDVNTMTQLSKVLLVEPY